MGSQGSSDVALTPRLEVARSSAPPGRAARGSAANAPYNFRVSITPAMVKTALIGQESPLASAEARFAT